MTPRWRPLPVAQGSAAATGHRVVRQRASRRTASGTSRSHKCSGAAASLPISRGGRTPSRPRSGAVLRSRTWVVEHAELTGAERYLDARLQAELALDVCEVDRGRLRADEQGLRDLRDPTLLDRPESGLRPRGASARRGGSAPIPAPVEPRFEGSQAAIGAGRRARPQHRPAAPARGLPARRDAMPPETSRLRAPHPSR